jgi:hypothetical protein
MLASNNRCVRVKTGSTLLLGTDTPHGLKPDGLSVLWGGLRHRSPTGLPGPFSILGGGVVAPAARAPVRVGVPADGHAFRDHDAAARTGLAGVGS